MTRTRWIQISLCALVVFTSVRPVSGGETVTARVASIGAFGAAQVTIRAFIERDSRNRFVEFAISSADFYRSSRTQLEGDRAPRMKMITYERLPPGLYEVIVTVTGIDGVRGRYEQFLYVS